MTTLKEATQKEFRELTLIEPSLKSCLKKEKLLILKHSVAKSLQIDPLLKVEISIRKCDKLGVFEK